VKVVALSSMVRVVFGTALVAGGGAALTLVACSDDDASVTPSPGSTDASANSATDSASVLPVPPLLDAGAEAAPIACGSAMCSPADFRGVATLPGCCLGSACGVDLTTAAPFLPVPAACTALASPGVSDDQCPTYPSPSSLYVGDMQGCCRADHKCGIFVRLSSTLDLGCVTAAGYVDDAGAPTACGVDAGN
jgi:hypothetical protein